MSKTPDNNVEQMQADRSIYDRLAAFNYNWVGSPRSKIMLGFTGVGDENKPPILYVGIHYKEHRGKMAGIKVDPDGHIESAGIVPKSQLPFTPPLSQLMTDVNLAIRRDQRRTMAAAKRISQLVPNS
ncbi:hypothetical protein A3J13_00490 [Candidatus Daviesbacteria bacterium RIFCSPLOWO2_02_FULL_36_8]|uniref:Uncharacterized protein n=1 Tax=Candidatus Daviesbacteria bacterium RIFCSPLOWO2_02_FULL_36_8 TaxID=1797793 RepID=A0A1F5MG93_9BACT|nr:MAG: hypothetical protein A3J13_00490 [Candidatus Daviesbacteria bacterium RIFCSPLOWO2_02_FULL_36_8]